MAFVGNLEGPRESDIIDRLGSGYFGCSAAGLADDVSSHVLAEIRNEVAPVHVDDRGQPFIEFSSPDPLRPQRYYLEENGFFLEGEIKTFTEIEQQAWIDRCVLEKHKLKEAKPQ